MQMTFRCYGETAVSCVYDGKTNGLIKTQLIQNLFKRKKCAYKAKITGECPVIFLLFKVFFIFNCSKN